MGIKKGKEGVVKKGQKRVGGRDRMKKNRKFSKYVKNVMIKEIRNRIEKDKI